jgi:hypothetical protein
MGKRKRAPDSGKLVPVVELEATVHPDEGGALVAECIRHTQTSLLRKAFATLWKELVGPLCEKPSVPNEAFNAWIMASASTEPGVASRGGFDVLLQWALLCAPVRWNFCRTAADALRELDRYAFEAKKLVDAALQAEFDSSIQEIRKKLQEGRGDGAFAEQPNEAFDELKRTIFPRLAAVVERLAVDLGAFTCDQEALEEAEAGAEGKVTMVVEVAPATPLSVRVEHDEARCKVSLALVGSPPGGTGMRVRYELNREYWDRLAARHAKHVVATMSESGAPGVGVAIAAWRLLHRYQGLFGPGGEVTS